LAENERDAKPTLRAFYKDFGKGRKFRLNGIETGVHKFFLGPFQRKPSSSAVSLGSLAVGNMLKVVENRTEMAENKRDAKPTLRPFYKDFGKGRKFGKMALIQACTNFFGTIAAETKGFCC